MAGMRELKNRLKSIRATGQLAGAMKTVASAKFSKSNKILQNYTEYAGACGEVLKKFGSELESVLPCPDAEAPECLIVVTSNRGLCGSYNTALLAFADECFLSRRRDGKPFQIVTCGKMAQTYYEEHGVETAKNFNLPDVPEYEDCGEMFEYIRNEFEAGHFSSVRFIYQHFKNTLTQIPCTKEVLPLTAEKTEVSENTDALYIPDRRTVMKNACTVCLNACIFETVLEASTGAQAATLMAMREAYNNAEETAAGLNLEICRKRQSEVTSSVLETYAPEQE